MICYESDCLIRRFGSRPYILLSGSRTKLYNTFFVCKSGWMYFRVVLLVGGSLIGLFGSAGLHLPGSGPLAVLTMAFTAGI